MVEKGDLATWGSWSNGGRHNLSGELGWAVLPSPGTSGSPRPAPSQAWATHKAAGSLSAVYLIDQPQTHNPGGSRRNLLCPQGSTWVATWLPALRHLGMASWVLRKPRVHASKMCPQNWPRGRWNPPTAHDAFGRPSAGRREYSGDLGPWGRGSQAEKNQEGHPLTPPAWKTKTIPFQAPAGR